MTKAEKEALVKEGFDLDVEIKTKEKRLGEIKDILIAQAGGQVVEIPGEGCKAVVNYSARIASRVDPDLEPKVKKLAGTFFDKLFCKAPIDKFRDVAKALLGEKAEELTALLSGVPAPRVSFRKL
jgi:hypothetical protein